MLINVRTCVNPKLRNNSQSSRMQQNYMHVVLGGDNECVEYCLGFLELQYS